MHTLRFGCFLVGITSLAIVLPQGAQGAAPNSLVLNEVNAVSGTKYLENGNKDSAFNSLPVQGNGQNWMEFLVVQGDQVGDSYKNTLDLRGFTMNWAYNKDSGNFGSGTMQFSQDPVWAAVPRGTMITVSEWSDVWYDSATRTRTGGYDGLGFLKGTPKISGDNNVYIGASQTTDSDPHLFATDTSWNPGANGGGANGDWNLHVFAGDTPLGFDSNSQYYRFKYFNFKGTVTNNNVPAQVGTEAGGLFVANNDNWQYTLKDQSANVIQGPFGETGTGLGAGWAVNSMEMIKLEGELGRFSGNQPQSSYLTVGINDLNDGGESTFGKPNSWDDGLSHQGLDGLRNWLQMGDADLDGAVTTADYVIWRKHLNSPGGWRDGDFNGDGTVNLADFNLWRANFGGSTLGSGSGLSGSSSVPEPQTLVLLLLGLTSLAPRRKKHLTPRQ